MQKTKVGIIGCGSISGIYLQNLSSLFRNIELAACADIDDTRAKSTVAQKDEQGNLKYPRVKAMSVSELLADDDIRIVVNLTTPQAHYDVATSALNSGKSVYNEKPLTLGLDQGRELLALAQAKGLRVGCAPDTFMGAGIQTCRKLIEDGWIGKPTSATAFMCCPGHESWHPDPAFYYLKGGGPMFDMGPYYLTALVNLLGPVESVAGMTNAASDKRVCTSQSRKGEILAVEVPTHVAGLLKFSCGAIANIITSFDVVGHHLPHIEVHGTLGSLRVPDPNAFGGVVEYCRRGAGPWKEVPLTHPYGDNSRGFGVADMAKAIANGTEHRASGKLALHILEIMQRLHDSSDQQAFLDIAGKITKPQPIDMDLLEGEV